MEALLVQLQRGGLQDLCTSVSLGATYMRNSLYPEGKPVLKREPRKDTLSSLVVSNHVGKVCLA